VSLIDRCKESRDDSAVHTLLNISSLHRDLLKVLAFGAMLCDHIATAFGLNSLALHLIGRCSLPLFALVWGCNLSLHPVKPSSLNRLWITALLAQPGFWLAFRHAGIEWYQLNILFTFAVMSQLIVGLQKNRVNRLVPGVVALMVYVPLSTASYGLRGLLLMAVSAVMFRVSGGFRCLAVAFWVLCVLVLNLPHGPLMSAGGLLLSLLVFTLVSLFFPHSTRRIALSRWFAEGYAIHLAVLAVVVAITA